MLKQRPCNNLPRFRPEELEEWLQKTETQLKKWKKDPHDLIYAMILKAFNAEDLRRLLCEGLPSIHDADCVANLLWCIKVVFERW